MLVLAAILPAVADVDVQDAHRCLDREALDLEVRQVLGDEVVDRIDLSARLYGVDGWQLSLEVSEDGARLWERVMSVERADCSFLPALVARSVERGLSSLSLPGWGLPAPRRWSEPAELGLGVAVTMPVAVRVSFGLTSWIPLQGPFAWEVEGEILWSDVQPIHAGGGGAQVYGGWVATGPGVGFDVGRDQIRASVRGAFGPVWSVGRDLPDGAAADIREEVQLTPHSILLTDLGYAFRANVRASLRTEVALTRLDFGIAGGRAKVPEPLLRVGVAVVIAGPLRSSEGRGRHRP